MIINLFPTALYTSKYKGDLKTYIKKCLKLSKKISKGGGNWLQQPYNTCNKHDFFNDKTFKPLTDFFDEQASIFLKNLNMKKCLKKQSWFNLYNVGDSQEFHNHNWKSISGIFYLKAGPKDAKTIFKSPIKDYPADWDFDRDNFYTWKSYVIKPEQGTLLLFRSDLEHCVEKQINNSKRITIALNYSTT